MIQNTTQTLIPNLGFAKLWLKFFVFLCFSFSITAGSLFLQENFITDVPIKGIHYLSLDSANFKLQESLRSIAGIFTFDSKTEATRLEERVNDLFEDAVYFASLSDFTQMDVRIKKIQEFAQSNVFSVDFQKIFIKNLDSLLSYSLDSSVMKVYEGLEPVVFAFSKSDDIENALLTLLDKRADKIFGALDAKNKQAELLLITWKENADNFKQAKFAKYSDRIKKTIESDPSFFKKTLFDIFVSFSESAISASEDSKKPAMEKDLFVTLNKSLTEGKKLASSEKITFEECKSIFAFLLPKMRVFEKSLKADDMAVISFESQMKELQPFLAFVFSSDANYLHGSFDERFKAFVDQEEELSQISKIGGQNIKTNSKTLVPLEEAKNDFDSIGIIDAKVALLEEGSTWVKIDSAAFSGVTFKGLYDAERKIFSDLEISKEKYSQGVSLSKFPTFFLTVTGKVSSDETSNQASDLGQEGKTEPSTLEKVLKAKVVEKLTVLSFEVKEDMISIVDLKEGKVEVQDLNMAKVNEDPSYVSFEFFNDTNEVSQVKFETAIGPIIIPDQFAIAQMKERVDMLKKRSELEKAQEEAEPIEPEL